MGKEPALIESGQAYPEKPVDSNSSFKPWIAIGLLCLVCNGVIGGLSFSSYSTLESKYNEEIARLQEGDHALRRDVDQLFILTEVSISNSVSVICNFTDIDTHHEPLDLKSITTLQLA